MRVASVEGKLFGGTCVNTGCTPTKTLVARAYAAHLARRATDFGVVLGGEVRVDMKKVKARAAAVVANSRGGVETWLRGIDGCTVVDGHARFEGPNRVRVGQEVLTAPRIFVNVGGRASAPDTPGVQEVPFLTNRSMLELDHLPEHLVVVGGSYVGLEFAQMCRRFGAEVDGHRKVRAPHCTRGRRNLCRPLLVGSRPMTRVSRAVEKGETQGLMKVVVDAQTHRLLGAATLGTGGDEAIHGIPDIMNADVPFKVLERVVLREIL